MRDSDNGEEEHNTSPVKRPASQMLGKKVSKVALAFPFFFSLAAHENRAAFKTDKSDILTYQFLT